MFKCGFYEKEITPPLGCSIPGYFNLRRGSDVLDRLYAKAMVVSDGKETVAVLELDLCSITLKLRNAITDRINKLTGINPDNIVCGATHCHTGIPWEKDHNDDVANDAQEGYHRVLERLAADCVVLAYMHMEEAEIIYGKGNVDGISFCRNYYMKNGTPRTNPGIGNPDIIGPVAGVDNDLPILFARTKEGKPLGMLSSFACHQDCVDGTAYSGDYSSEMAKVLKATYGNDFVSVFMNGVSGNINHFDVVNGLTDEHYRKMGRKLAGEAVKALSFATAIKTDNVSACYEYLKLKRAECPQEDIDNAQHIVDTVVKDVNAKIAADNTDPDQYNLAMATSLLKFVNGPEFFDIPVQTLKIGDVALYAFPDEIFWQYGKMVKDNSPTEKNIVASCCNCEDAGYIPTTDMFYDTIYESLLGANNVEKNAGYIMVDKLKEQAEKIFKV